MTTAPSPKEDIVAFAEVQASLSDPFGDRDVTLALRGLDERAWQSIEAAWIARLAKDDDAAAQLARAFGDAFESARKAPGKQRGRTGSLADAMAEATARQDLPTSGSPPASPAVKPLAVPSFLKDRQAESPGAPVPPPAAPPAMGTPLATPPTPGYTGTAAVDLAALFKSAVPFDPSAKESLLANPAPAAAPARDNAQQVFNGTSPAPQAARPPASLSKSALSGETADVDIGAIARQVLAFGAPRPAQNPTFTLDQYAQLSAELAHDADPAARSAVLARYGVQSGDALATEWRARFSADPALAGRWSAAYAHHYARLMAERGPRR